jgi:hypothetical protein
VLDNMAVGSNTNTIAVLYHACGRKRQGCSQFTAMEKAHAQNPPWCC